MDTPTYERLVRELTPAARQRLKRKHYSLRDDHDDILQDSLISLTRRLDAGEPDDPAALLAAIIDFRAMDKARQNKSRSDLETPIGGMDELSHAEENGTFVPALAPPDAGRNIFATEFDQSVRGLPTAQRETFILCELRGLTIREAAQYLNLPKSTVADRLADARDAIKMEVSA